MKHFKDFQSEIKTLFAISLFRVHSPTKKHGFTLIESMLVVAVLVILLAIGAGAFQSFHDQADLTNGSQEVIDALRRAQSSTVASENDSTFGVHFDTGTSPHTYTLFQGADYASRTVSLDKVFSLQNSVEFSAISLGGGSEVIFDRIDGTTSNAGSVTVRLRDSPSQTKTVYIDVSGVIEITSATPPSDTARIKDSRHAHFDYTRAIDTSITSTEKIVLTFSAATQEILIQDNIQGGQIVWEGDIDDGGETQHIKIHTHTLNDPVLDTQFSIHRDQRFNTKPLRVDIDGIPDPDVGTLIEYDASGQTTQGTSIYASAPNWQ